MNELLQRVKTEYFITENTSAGRIDWAINDFIASNNLTIDQKNSLVMTTSQEVANA